MKRFILTILAFFITFFLLEKVFWIFLILSPPLEYDKRLEKVIKGELDKDLIVLGSSRGARNIIAGQIEDSLKISSYNLSYPGSDIEFHEFLLSTYLKFNKAPKVLLLVVDDPSELLPSESIKFRLDRLYPLARYSNVNNELIKRGDKNFLSRFLVLARINKRNFDLRKKYFSEIDTISNCGSMPISFQRKDRKFVFDSNVKGYNESLELPNKVEAFLSLLSQCEVNGTKIFVIFPPNFYSNNRLFEKRIKELTTNYSINFITYNTNDSLYKDKSIFYDEGHLARNGAVVFTNEVINKLKLDKFFKEQTNL